MNLILARKIEQKLKKKSYLKNSINGHKVEFCHSVCFSEKSIFIYFVFCYYKRWQWAIFRFHVCNMVMMTLDYRISVFRCTFRIHWFLAMTFANHAQKVWRWPFMTAKKKFRADTWKKKLMSCCMKCLSFLWMFHYNIVSQGNLAD